MATAHKEPNYMAIWIWLAVLTVLEIWVATTGRRRNARWTCKSQGSAASWRPTRKRRATCKQCAGRGTCWRRIDPGGGSRG